jgi:hypothetical protein
MVHSDIHSPRTHRSTDPEDVNSPQTTSFTVTVVEAAGQLTALQHSVVGVGPGTSFSSKLAQVQSYLTASDKKDTCSTLMAFINEVTAALSKKAGSPLYRRRYRDQGRFGLLSASLVA